MCGGAGGDRVEMDERVESWLEGGDTGEFGFDEFERGDLFCAEERDSFSDGSVMERGHGPSF
jgi:hypothetical protein